MTAANRVQKSIVFRQRSSRALGNSSTEAGVIRVPTSATTLKGFRSWATSDCFPQRGRVSFLDGEVWIDMSPEELETHNKVKEVVCRTVGTLNEELDLGELYVDGTLLTHEDAGISTEPDGILVKWRTSASKRIRLVSRRDEVGEFIELQDSPDWVLEVVSRFSERKDVRVLRRKYFRAGIPEYWLIDARGIEISFRILVPGRAGYRVVKPRAGWHWSPVFGRWFCLERERNRAGRWRYLLLVKSE